MRCHFLNLKRSHVHVLHDVLELRNVVGPPCFSIISNITPLCASIAFRICSIFISSQLERTSFTNPLFVRRLGFRFWNFAFNPPFKFFHVWLTDWSNLLDSQDYLQGTLPHLPVLVRWTLQFQFGPLPFQLLAKLRCQISPMLPSHTQIEFFRKKCGYIWVELFVIVSENYFPASCLKFGSKFFFYNLCNCLGTHLFQFKTVYSGFIEGPDLFFRFRAQCKWIARSFHEIAANACGSKLNDYLVTVTVYLDWKFWGSCWRNTFSVPIIFCKPCRVMTSIDCSCFGGGGMIPKDPTFFLFITPPSRAARPIGL